MLSPQAHCFQIPTAFSSIYIKERIISGLVKTSPDLLNLIMPSFRSWYCGWCNKGPMSLANEDYCWSCYRARDGHATYETDHSSPSSSSIASQTFTSSETSSRNRVSYEHGSPPRITTQGEYSPVVYGPAVYWYCCACHDGPKVIAIQPACVICDHVRCRTCKLA